MELWKEEGYHFSSSFPKEQRVSFHLLYWESILATRLWLQAFSLDVSDVIAVSGNDAYSHMAIF